MNQWENQRNYNTYLASNISFNSNRIRRKSMSGNTKSHDLIALILEERANRPLSAGGPGSNTVHEQATELKT